MEKANLFALPTPPQEGVCMVPSSGIGLASLAIKIEGHAVRKRLLAPLWFVKGVVVQYCSKRSPMRDHLTGFYDQYVLMPIEIPSQYIHAVFFVWAELMGVISSHPHKGPLGVHVPLVRCLKGTAAEIAKTIEFLLQFFNSSYACAHLKQSKSQKKGDSVSIRRKGAKCLTMARLLPLESTEGQPHLEVFFPQAEAIVNFEDGHFVSLNPDLLVALRGPKGLKKLIHYFLFEMNKRFCLHGAEPLAPRPTPCVVAQTTFAQAARSHSETLSTAVPLYDHGVLTWNITAPAAPISQLRGNGPGGGVLVCWFPSEQTQAAAELEATLEAHMRLAGAWDSAHGAPLGPPAPKPLLPPPEVGVAPTPAPIAKKRKEPTPAAPLFSEAKAQTPKVEGATRSPLKESVEPIPPSKTDVVSPAPNPHPQPPPPPRPLGGGDRETAMPTLFQEKAPPVMAQRRDNPRQNPIYSPPTALKKMPITHRAGATSKPPTGAHGTWRLFEDPLPPENPMSEAEFLTQVLELYESLTPLQRRHFELDRATMNEDQFRSYVMPILLKRQRVSKKHPPGKHPVV